MLAALQGGAFLGADGSIKLDFGEGTAALDSDWDGALGSE